MKKIVLSLILCIIITGTMSVSAVAAGTVTTPNTGDTDVPTDFITYTSALNTPTRRKANNSTVYINNTSGMDLWVYANRGLKPDNLPKNRMYDTDTTVGGHAIVYHGKYAIRNTIFKKNVKGYQTAWLNITTTKNSVSGKCAGKWSPDTAGKYRLAN